MTRMRFFLFLPCFVATFLVAGAALLLSSFHSRNSNDEPWTEAQLMNPAELQQRLTDKTMPAPLVLSIGPGAIIKGSEDMGAAHEDSNMTKLKQRLASLPRNTELVIYCGCCPFVHCPNIRPAFAALNELKFTKARLLNIEHNIKTDWISKGYLSTP